MQEQKEKETKHFFVVGAAALWDNAPFALVGSGQSNDETITEILMERLSIGMHDDKPIPSPLDPNYTPAKEAATESGGSHA